MSKIQISKIIQADGFLSSLLSKTPGPFLAPLGKAAASAIDAGIQKKIHGSGTTALIISNKEMDDIIKSFQAFEDSNISLKGITKAIENETN